MIPFDVAIAPGSGLWQAAAGSDVFLAALSAGVLGMGLTDLTSGITDRLSGDDADDDGGLDDIDDDDDFLGDGDDVDDDEFGDLDGWDDDDEDFDDFGGGDGGGALDEIEPRLNELENELASVSSTMGTVRSENDAINETVEDMEDNIRKLLEIYEMVTRGVNPFVDDVEGAAGMGGSFGLFDGEDSGGGGEDIDPDVAEADADSFFDDGWDDEGLDEEGFDDGDGFEEDDGFDDGGEFDDAAFDGGEVTAADSGESESSEGGKTFDQLKSEYEGGEVDWDDEGDDGGSDDETAAGDDASGSDTGKSDSTDIEETDTTSAEIDEASEPPEVESTGAIEETGNAAGEDAVSADDGKPYLYTLPDGYGSELLVIEWLSYLRECSSTPEALRAIRYYETIGWIGEPAADSLAKFLTGLTDGDLAPPPTGGTQLTVNHHTQSLRYIGRLGGTEVQIERLDWAGSPRQSARIEGGKQRGIQR